MKLTLRDMATLRNGQVYGTTGRAFLYEVQGLPAGEQAMIRDFGGKWRVRRTKNGVEGQWTGDYDSAEEALAREFAD